MNRSFNVEIIFIFLRKFWLSDIQSTHGLDEDGVLKMIYEIFRKVQKYKLTWQN